MTKTRRFAAATLFGILAVTIAACGGGGDAAGTGSATDATPAASCTVAKPQCTVSSSPATSADNPVPAGTNVVLTAKCDTSVTQADWFTNAKTFASGMNVTVNPSATTSYGFTYKNCAGGDATGLWVYVGSGSSSGGSAGTSTGTGGSATVDSGASGSGGLKSGVSAMNCVRMGHNASGSTTITNTCGGTISYTFCNLYAAPAGDTGTLFVCKGQRATYSPSGYVYEQGSDGLGAGNTQVILGTRVNNQVTWVIACATGLPHITNFDTSTIGPNSKATGICVL
ncbi:MULTISPECIES: hypothetical protein [Cupriavidus]|jgi:hypothetical protein|uniref:Ig-like domain-containing protein n=1 Tax=Cupriavidus metallidurans TaxID=119219 RepID=A0A482IVK0_9BURK|nr:MULTISPECIES: hypothetical protein [Cupriavidus]KWR81657.1 hypothetical protein RN01_15335 [Cupriavidus sp. SHE]QBP12978.1 hypothetical protein DDF84_025330 [Cupriavidus metallidurans]QWC90770.1 hypothetical protein KB891_24915 [Cupriavidus metallidurans]